MSPTLNTAALFEATAREFSGRPAVWYARGSTYEYLTFSTLWHYSGLIAAKLFASKLRAGDKTLVMLKPGPELLATVIALFRLGAVPVMIDPGMGIPRLLQAVGQIQPDALIALPSVHYFRLICPKPLRSVKKSFCIGFGALWVKSLPSARAMLAHVHAKRPFPEIPPMYQPTADESAAILFTTGSTGPAKGVVYTHGTFRSQAAVIREVYGAGADFFDMPVFPLFALFSAALGMPCVIPPVNPSQPAKANGAKVLKLINRFKVSFSFGSPAFWKTMTDHCEKNHRHLHSVQRILMAGAPPSVKLLESMRSILPDDAQILIPYGATEALPIASFSAREILTETAEATRQGAGYCVGYPVPGADIRIIRLIDGAVETWSDELELPAGQYGEITVSGPMVTREYANLPEATRLSKIRHPDGSVRHRMGDCGYRDAKGRIWFCGRKNHRVVTASGATFYSVCTEALFNEHASVVRSALAGIGENRSEPVVIIETPERDAQKLEALRSELLELAKQSPLTCAVRTILFHPAFPVDIRHNAKIFREQLAIWAEGQVKR